LRNRTPELGVALADLIERLLATARVLDLGAGTGRPTPAPGPNRTST
jgi:hypothetical protein